MRGSWCRRLPAILLLLLLLQLPLLQFLEKLFRASHHLPIG